MLLNPYVLIGILAALVASAGGGYIFGYSVADDKGKAEILTLQNNANKALAEKAQEVLGVTKRNNEIAQQIEVINRENEQKINAALASNRAARLRYKTTVANCKPVPGVESSGSATEQSKPVEVELPKTITDDLFTLAADADKIANYADTCYQWVKAITKKPK